MIDWNPKHGHAPEVKSIALSNVYTRMMFFAKAGDTEVGHHHEFDHATLVSSGSVLVEILSDEAEVISSKEFVAPTMVFIEKFKNHRIVALEDNTVAACIHALRTVDETLIDPDFIIDPSQLEGKSVPGLIKEKYEMGMRRMTMGDPAAPNPLEIP
jgi:hypothetical protein